MAKKKRNTPNMQKKPKVSKLEQLSEELINAQEERLAAMAWEGYQQEGRGMIILSYTEEDGIDAVYAGQRGEMWKAVDFETNIPSVAKAVKEYNPMTQMVIINGVPEEKRVFVYDDLDVPPPIAYQKLMAE